MDLGLKGKVAVVSGSTAGIGLAIASTLAAEGAHVVLNGRTEERVTAAVDSIMKQHKGAHVRGVAADLGKAEGVAKFVRQVPEADVLINNLGIFEVKAFADIPDSEWLRFFEVNVLSGVRLTRERLWNAECLAHPATLLGKRFFGGRIGWSSWTESWREAESVSSNLSELSQ